ncbi:hypothetical protein GGF50DRAFT_21639, partial [Schizophyllum commune]
NDNVVDLYSASPEIDEGKNTARAFMHDVWLCGPGGRRTRLRALVDDGALVGAMCERLYKLHARELGDLRASGRVLRMANGARVRSSGRWSGSMVIGRTSVCVEVEVFPSDGDWELLLGKPILQQLHASHDYATDTITI